MRPKISLCMIVGNVEDYIQRCLESFAPIADEICLVRAIGSQAPDDTIAIAEATCRRLGKPFRWQEYRNDPARFVIGIEKFGDPAEGQKYTADLWPHTDNFAAARQQAYDMALGDYCIWVDSDDVLEAGAEIVRDLVEHDPCTAYLFPYRIFARGVTVPRERLMLRNSGKWRFPVHECFDFHITPVNGIQDDRIVVRHLPFFKTKTGSNERNLRILRSIPEKDMSAGLLYHLSGELAGIGDLAGSIETSKKALAMPDLGKTERYEIFLNLARQSKDPNVKEDLLHAAYKTDPRRREALGLLTCNALDYGKNDLAMAYANQMRGTPRPMQATWNEREATYGWLGTEIYTQALRSNGMERQADALRRLELQAAGGARITLVHATRGRAQQAAMARKLWMDLAERPDRVEHVFAIDEDDPESEPLKRMHNIVVRKGGGCVRAWNMGAMTASAPILVAMSDDWMPPAAWDQLICDRIGDPTKPAVLAVNDGIRKDNLLCLPILTTAYFLQDYYLFHPWFRGVYSDNWFTSEAYRRGQVIEARDIEFTHQHPIATGSELDKTYKEQNSPERYHEGKAVLDLLEKRTDWSTVPGFFNYYEFYRITAEKLKDGDTIAEVGTWLGRSIIFMAQTLQRLGRRVNLIAVDTFKGEQDQPAHVQTVTEHGGSIRQAFEQNLSRCGVSDMVQVLECDSAKAAEAINDGTLAFVFIDAAHDYESVKRDIEAWKPKLKPGGIMAGHDAQHEPVLKAVHEVLGKDIGFFGNVWVMEPTKLG